MCQYLLCYYDTIFLFGSKDFGQRSKDIWIKEILSEPGFWELVEF
jgi:hypothetical protein